MKCYFTCFLILININLFAQQVQWSSKILDFSTQHETNDYSAVKLLGPPDVPADAGMHPAAWMARTPNEKEFLAVGFDSAMHVRQIAIFESFNPGAIYKVYLYDERNILHVIGTMDPKPSGSQGRVLNILIEETPYKVTALRLIIDGTIVQGFNAIDAIGISNSTELIQKHKNFAYRRNPRLKTEEISLGARPDESDTRPVYSDRMKRLYFTRGYSSKNTGSKSDPGDVMVVLYSEANNSFSSPLYMGETINNIGFNTTNGIVVEDGSEKLLIGNVTGNISKIDANVALVSKDKDGDWSVIEEQDIRKSGIFDLDADYHITAGRQIMFLAAERKDGMGGRDLYVSFNSGNNKWSEPENLGGLVNSAGDEFAPFYSRAENALYFASRGHGGMGGSDIFRVIRLDDTFRSWSEPENIGPDVNTQMDEKYFYFDDDDESAFFARAKDETSYGIFVVDRPKFIDPTPLVTLKGRVTSDGQPLAAAISTFTIPEDKLYNVTFSDESTGLYSILLRSGYDYKLLGESEGYNTEELLVSLENRNEPYSYELDLKLSRDLMEESPELEDEIAGITASAGAVSASKVADPAEQKTVSTGSGELDEPVAGEAGITDPSEKASKLASLPQIKKEDTTVEPEPDAGKQITETVAGMDNTSQDTEPAAVVAGEPDAPSRQINETPDDYRDVSNEPDPLPVSAEMNSGQKEKSSPTYSEKGTAAKSRVNAENLVRFTFNSAELLPQTEVILDMIIDFLNRHETIKLEIGGFTDHIGDEFYNQDLGKRRAQTVKNYFMGKGIAGYRIRIIGFGEKMPIVLSNDREMLMTNRRVEFNFTK